MPVAVDLVDVDDRKAIFLNEKFLAKARIMWSDELAENVIEGNDKLPSFLEILEFARKTGRSLPGLPAPQPNPAENPKTEKP